MDYWTNISRVTRPTSPIIEVETAQNYLRVSDDEELIENLIEAATDYIEGPTGIGLALQISDWKLVAEHLPARFHIALGPITQISTVEVDGQTLSNVRLINDEVVLDGPVSGLCEVRFKAGHAVVPSDIKQAVLWLVAHWYENRADEEVSIPAAVDRVLAKYVRC